MEDFDNSLKQLIPKVFDYFSDKEIYLVGSASLYLQGISIENHPHDVDFIIVSKEEDTKKYKRFFSLFFKETKLFIDIIVNKDNNIKEKCTEVTWNSIKVKLMKPEFVLKYKEEYLNTCKSENKEKHKKQLKYILEHNTMLMSNVSRI